MSDWKTIESAPKDKTRVLLAGHRADLPDHYAAETPIIGHYYSTAGGSAGPIYWFKVPGGMHAPTHWMPLPNPPEAA